MLQSCVKRFFDRFKGGIGAADWAASRTCGEERGIMQQRDSPMCSVHHFDNWQSAQIGEKTRIDANMAPSGTDIVVVEDSGDRQGDEVQ